MGYESVGYSPSPLIAQPRHHHALPGLLQPPYFSANIYSSSFQTILQKADSMIIKNVKQIMYFHCSSTFSSFPSQNIFLPLLHHAWPYWFPVCFYNMPVLLCLLLHCCLLCKEAPPHFGSLSSFRDQFSATSERPPWHFAKVCAHCQLFLLQSATYFHRGTQRMKVILLH